MDLASVLVTSGRENKQTLASIDRTMKQVLAQTTKQNLNVSAQARRDAADKSRAAADRKVQVDSNKQITDRLDKIFGAVDDIEDSLKDIEKKTGKGGGGGGMPSIPWKTLAKGALAAGIVAAVVAAIDKGNKDQTSGNNRAIAEEEARRGKPLTQEEAAKLLTDKTTNQAAIAGAVPPGVQTMLIEQAVAKGNHTMAKDIVESLEQSRGKGIFGTTHQVMGEDAEGVTKDLAIATRNRIAHNDKLYELTQQAAQVTDSEEKSQLMALIAEQTRMLEAWRAKEQQASEAYDASVRKEIANELKIKNRMDELSQQQPAILRQSGGPVKVPGSGSGDKVPAMLPPGSFVLNRNASNFLMRQKGGGVPALLEPGELVYPKTTPGLESLNRGVPRFQEGGQVQDDGGFQLPLTKGRVGIGPAQVFGAPRDGGSRLHAGVDLVETSPWGSDPKLPCVATKSGVVMSEKYTTSGYTAGLMVKQNDGMDVRYVHMIPEATPGTQVQAGDRVGRLKDLGNDSHLHFELYRGGSSNALDPAPYLQSAGKSSGSGRTIPGMQTAPDGTDGSETGVTRGPGAPQAATANDPFGGFGGLLQLTGLLTDVGSALSGQGIPGLAEDIQNYMNPGNSSSSSSDTGTTGSVSGTKGNEVQVAKNLMKDLGVNKNIAAGIVGNLSYESAGLSPNIREGMTFGNSFPAGRKDTPAGYGWAQWSFDRHDKFVNEHLGGFGGEGGGSKREAKPQDNYNYLLEEIRGPEPITGMPDNDVVAATDWFRKNWERAGVPADEKRRAVATDLVTKLQSGGMVPTLLEPGETVGTMSQWNKAIPRFQQGGSVHMGGRTTPTSQNFYEKTDSMEMSGGPTVIMMPSPPQQPSQPAMNDSASSSAPGLSNGPSMTAISDYINRVSWSSVF